MDAQRLGVTPLSFDPVLETRSSQSPRARPRVVASGSQGTVICDHHERAGGCVGGIVPREQQRRHALRRTWCERRVVSCDTDDASQITPRLHARQPRVHTLGPGGRLRPGTASIAQEPRLCRAEASSMPEGPATGRIEAERRALTTVSTAPDSRARCWSGHFCVRNSVHMRAHCRCESRTTSRSRFSPLVSGRSRRSTGHAGGAFRPDSLALISATQTRTSDGVNDPKCDRARATHGSLHRGRSRHRWCLRRSDRGRWAAGTERRPRSSTRAATCCTSDGCCR